MNENNFSCIQAPLRKNQRAHNIVGDHSACVSYDVRIAVVETEHLENIHAAVHAGHNGEAPFGLNTEAVVSENLHKCAVVFKELIGIGKKGGFCVFHDDILPLSSSGTAFLYQRNLETEGDGH